jgi:nucleosome assembly protein 1-like 1
VKKKQRNKKTGQERVITKEVEGESFFSFFKSIDISDEEKMKKMADNEVFDEKI